MIAIQQPQQPTVNKKALAWTVGVHVLLLLLFIFLKYNIEPAPPPVNDGGGMEVNLGTSDNGSGNDQPMSRKDPAAYQASVVYKSMAVKSAVPKNILQSTNEDDPSLNTANKKKEHPVVNEDKSHPKEAPRHILYSYPGAIGQGGNGAKDDKKGTSEGNTTGPGDRGVVNGTPGASNYTGTPGDGTGGIGHTLTGREIYPKTFEAEFHEGGKVVIHVTVDRNGTIINKLVKSSSNSQLTRIALDKLANVHFSKSTGSEPEQSGDITIRFNTRQ